MNIDFAFSQALLTNIEHAKSMSDWLVRPLAFLQETLSLKYIGVWKSAEGTPTEVAGEGETNAATVKKIVLESMESHSESESGGIVANSIAGGGYEPLVLVISASPLPTPKIRRDLCDALIDGLHAWQLIQGNHDELSRLRLILQAAEQWVAKSDLESLLTSVAESAATILNADRASIFLWDKPAKQLVGHPALGVEGQALRIPEDAGVAGAVLKTCEPRLWDRNSPSDEVDRTVDANVGYQTDSLLAVPIVDGRKKLIGVFEVLNHRNGQFSKRDVATLSELAKHTAAALSNTQKIQNLVKARDRLTQDAANQSPLLGECEPIQGLKSKIAKVAPTDLAVLILGENGVGKEVVARRVHFESARRHEPFIAVNCAAIAETLLESELFGHEKGAFTDAHETRAGNFEIASGGTLFLDEIGDMSPGGQAKLLRVLEEKVVVRVGGSKTIPVDVRIVAATNQKLVELVEAKKFREDLYFRLTVVTLEIPALRQRHDDILLLADHFLHEYCDKIQRQVPTFTSDAKNQLRNHSWPGNVRELRNLIERLVYLTDSDTISASDLEFVQSPSEQHVRPAQATIDFNESLAEATADFQAKIIRAHIDHCSGNMTEAAKSLGLQRSNLYRKIKQLDLDV